MAYPGTVGVLALQGDSREHLAILADIGVAGVAVRTPAELEAVDSLILPGGESTAISLLLETSGLLGPLRARLAAGMPAFGTCAGMILLAREVTDGRPDQHHLDALDVVVRRNAFGRQVDSFEADLDVAGLEGGPLHAVFIRAPAVESAGGGVEVLATAATPDGCTRPVVCRQGRVMVAAFHPELSGDPRLHRLFLERAAA
ncbi:MAG: pyridoxal 5'-phosphate synthase glutaminase subunit PdxT [Acidimicrobiales bacterium]